MKRIPWPEAIAPAAYKINDDTVHSTIFDDPYFSKSGGLAEKRHVFVEANHVEDRFRRSKKVTILEFGFGLGLNLLCTLDAYGSVDSDCVLDYVAFEKYPLTKDQLRECLRASIGKHAHAESVIAKLPPLISGFHRIILSPKIILTLIYGDAGSAIKELDASVDVFYLDGFSPKKNEDLWSPHLFASFRRLAATGASFSTYSSAGAVRRGMAHAGFDTQVKTGFAQKKEMLVGVFSDKVQTNRQPVDNVRIIGGGIAGCSLALRASELGLKVTLVDSGRAVMGQGSSNPLPLVRPTISLDFGPRGQLSWYAYFYAMRLYRMWSETQALGWQEIGAIQLAQTGEDYSKMRNALKVLSLGQDFLKCVEQGSSALKGLSARISGGVLISPVGQLSKCQTGFAEALRNQSIEVLTQISLSDLDRGDFLGERRTTSEVLPLVLANPQTAQRLVPAVDLRLQPIRGQSTRVKGMGKRLRFALCGDGYLSALDDGSAWSSGTFDLNDESEEIRAKDNLLNLNRISNWVDSIGSGRNDLVTESWVGVRYATYDRMPHVGSLSQGVYALTGLGSKGFTWGPLAAEVIVSELLGLSCPVERSIKKRMSPLRFG
ncbi:MAG: tRNA (5-methylaminomethyl-2-thiouridine)(34)-methyltransferase MnmD [Burkholderiales bacterium]|nr:tRNA (5-methylaminomethyl-2-thiouridine)(34)-methyltransferase MnmD [Burkholderiales bacterium]OUT79646.1 MAG: hypothetical protein CBB82_00720 [Betaproteobacteria bacterium TMED22]|tara:strand:- start:33546 stop:35354 length:1809 start_codon:yes stop_codon:yes gene_type:complete